MIPTRARIAQRLVVANARSLLRRFPLYIRPQVKFVETSPETMPLEVHPRMQRISMTTPHMAVKVHLRGTRRAIDVTMEDSRTPSAYTPYQGRPR